MVFGELIRALLQRRIKLGYKGELEELLKASESKSFLDEARAILKTKLAKVKKRITCDGTCFELACYIFSVNVRLIINDFRASSLLVFVGIY